MHPTYAPVGAGARREAHTIQGFSLTEARYSSPTTLETHVHRHPVVVFVLRGAVRERFTGRSEECSAGTALTIPADHPHSETFLRERTDGLIVEVTPDKAAAIRSLSPMLDQHRALKGFRIGGFGVELLRELEAPDDATGLAIEGLMLQLAAAAAREPLSPERDRRPRWLRTVTEAMTDGLDRPLRIVDLAACAGVHPVYLARAFRRHYGCSPAEFIRRLRVEAARAALVGTTHPLTRVARESGFADQSHFTRTFRRLVGTSPGRYRKERRA